MSSSPAAQPVQTGPAWPDYRAIWRWHFYAGLFTFPFVIILSISGAIYLFKPQIEAWKDYAYDHLDLTGTPAPPSAQVTAAIAAFPDSKAVGYEIPASPQAAARVLVQQQETTYRVYVHPQSLEILHSLPEDSRFMRQMFKLHGELLLGDRGSNLVEIASSWTIVMILTGLCLWWPRSLRGLGGILYPRLRMGSRILWRDIHSVTGIWISLLVLFLLATGLPWAKFWGGYFKGVRQLTGTAVAKQDWTTGSERPPAAGGTQAGGGGEHAGHTGGGNRRRRKSGMPTDLTPLDRVVATVQPLALAPPVIVAAPAGDSANWSAKSNAANRPLRVDLTVNGQTGEIVRRENFSDRHLVDRIVGTCIAAHEGQLFGWPNQLLGLIAALGLIVLSISGVILWWRRRDQGVLGAPPPLASPRLSWGLIGAVIALGIYLPLFALTLCLVLIVERVVLTRIPPVSLWLGLTVAAPREAK
ncbi:MAG: PepSY domain-containing protein [Planctomycetes bacterium]|nr:PepSY domain-containing protein [Planctomycetota bacterium]